MNRTRALCIAAFGGLLLFGGCTATAARLGSESGPRAPRAAPRVAAATTAHAGALAVAFSAAPTPYRQAPAASPRRPGRPPVRLSQVAMEFLGGWLGTMAGIGPFIPGVFLSMATDSAIFANATLYGGVTAGAALGVHYFGSTDEVTGSFPGALAGAALLGLPLGLASEGIGLFYGAPLGAVLGFELSRQYRSPGSPRALNAASGRGAPCTATSTSPTLGRLPTAPP